MELLKNAIDGNESAQQKLFQTYQPHLRTMAHRLLPHALKKRCDSSDIVQQTCLHALESLADFRGATELEFTSWLNQILKSNIGRALRKNTAARRDVRMEVSFDERVQSRGAVPGNGLSSEPNPTEIAIRGEAALRLIGAIARLPEDNAVAISLRYLEGFSLSEIADSMDRSIGSIAGLIHRGLDKLHDILGEEPSL